MKNPKKCAWLLCSAGTLLVASLAAQSDLTGASLPSWRPEANPTPMPMRIALVIQGSNKDPRLDASLFEYTVRGNPQDPEHKPGLAQVLLDDLGFNYVEVLDGERVTEGHIRFALNELATRFQTDGNLLCVYWVGHGFLVPEGLGKPERQLLTYVSKLPATGNGIPDGLLPLLSLKKMISDVRGELNYLEKTTEVVLAVDACAVLSASIHEAVDESKQNRDFELEAFSSSHGQQAYPDHEGLYPQLAFTRATLRSLREQCRGGSREANLKLAFEEASRVVPSQLPEVQGEPLLAYDPKGFQLAVRVADEDRLHETLAAAHCTLLFQGADQSGDGTAVFRGIRGPGFAGYRLKVSAEGYISRMIDVGSGQDPDELREAIQQGRRAVIPMVREFVCVQVEARQLPGASANFQLLPDLGEDASAWLTKAQRRGSGRVLFRIPPSMERFQLLADGAGTREHDQAYELSQLTRGELSSDLFGRIPLFTLESPVVLGVDEVIVSVRVEQEPGVLSRVYPRSHSELAQQVFGPDTIEFRLPEGEAELELVAEVREREEDHCKLSLARPSGEVTERGLPVPLFEAPPLKIARGGLWMRGELKAPDGLRVQSLRYSTEASSRSGASTLEAAFLARDESIPVGPFEFELPMCEAPFTLRFSGDEVEELRIQIDPSGGREQLLGGRRFTLYELAPLQLIPSRALPPSPSDEFWQLISECRGLIDAGETEKADKVALAAKKLTSDSKDVRNAFVYYYRGMALLRASEGASSSSRKRNNFDAAKHFATALRTCTNTAKGPDGLLLCPSLLYHKGECEALLWFVEGSASRRAEAERIVALLEKSFPGAKHPEGISYSKKLEAEIQKWVTARNKLHDKQKKSR